MNTIAYADARHGSVFDEGFDPWGIVESGNARAVPPTPEGLRFEAGDEAFVSTGFLRLKGWLINETDEEKAVGLFAAPNAFRMEFVDAEAAGIKELPYEGPPRPPPAPPPPTVLFIPPLTRVEFEAVIGLGQYEYEAGAEVELEWQFNFWNLPKPKGRLRAVVS